MGLDYKTQEPFVIIGTKTTAGVRTGWTLESTYQDEGTTKATKTIPVGGFSKLNLDILYTMGSGETSNTIEVIIEGSPDRTNFYRIPNESVSGGTSTLANREWTFVGTNGTTATTSIGLDIFYKYVRVSVKESGVSSTKGTVFVEATLSGF